MQQIIHFTLNKNNFNELNQLAESVLASPDKPGLVITFDKNNLVFDRLRLKRLVELFMEKNKQLGLWGLPWCVLQTQLGGYLYSKIAHRLIPLPNLTEGCESSALLLECKDCSQVDGCCGLGIREENQKRFIWRPVQSVRYETARTISFASPLDKLHADTWEHIRRFPQDRSDRVISYADIFPIKGTQGHDIYHSRFIYFCNYLCSDELKSERSFITRVAISRDFAAHFFDEYPSCFKRYAYSLSTGKRLRETYYGWFIDEACSTRFLNKKTGNDILHSSHLIGVDIHEGHPYELKRYAKVKDEKLFFIWLDEEFRIVLPQIIKKSCQYYRFVERSDTKGRLISVKIEADIVDLPAFEKTLHHVYRINTQNLTNRPPKRIVAFDFTPYGEMRKITLYGW